MNELKDKILNTEDKNTLYSCQIELTEQLGTLLEQRCSMEKDSLLYTQTSNEIKYIYSLLEVCKDKIVNWKDTHGKVNYNFRMAAKEVLDKDVYDHLMSLAHLPRDIAKKKMKDGRE